MWKVAALFVKSTNFKWWERLVVALVHAAAAAAIWSWVLSEQCWRSWRILGLLMVLIVCWSCRLVSLVVCSLVSLDASLNESCDWVNWSLVSRYYDTDSLHTGNLKIKQSIRLCPQVLDTSVAGEPTVGARPRVEMDNNNNADPLSWCCRYSRDSNTS